LPHIEDGEWFFDTVLLLLAEERGLRISEVPVDWIEDLDSRVNVVSTAIEDIKGLLRVWAQRLRRRLSGRRSRNAVDTAHHARSWRLIAQATVEARKVDGRGRMARD